MIVSMLIAVVNIVSLYRKFLMNINSQRFFVRSSHK